METINEREFPLNNNNYEVWLLRYAEDKLTAAERETVEAWLATHPEAAEELALYQEAPRLECNGSVQYGASVQRRTMPLWSMGWRWAAAAAVVLLLTVPAVHLMTPQQESVELGILDAEVVQQVLPEEEEPLQEMPEASVTKHRPARHAPIQSSVVAPLLAEAEKVDPLPDVQELQEPEWVVQEVEAEVVANSDFPTSTSELIYVDNLFVKEEPDELEQSLLDANDFAKERLQSTYLGRRLARRLPDDNQLLAYADNVRERTPQGVRMVADMIRTYREMNK